MATAVGDVTQIPVTTRPTQAIPALGEGITVTLYNTDLTNNAYVSYQQWFSPGALNSIPIRPLQSIPFDASKPLYIAGTVNGQGNLLVVPGGQQIQPSPADAAASINALGLATLARQITQETNIPNNIATTGVPALNLKTATTLATNQAIAAGATFSPTAITGINQPAYNLHLTGTAGGASTKPWYTVTVKWVDTASGLTVQFDQFTAFMSSTSNALSTVIYGPADADQMVVTVTNNDTVGMTLNSAYVIISSRSNYTSDTFYQFFTTGNMPAVPTFQIAASAPVPAQKIIFSLTRTVGIGVTTAPDYALPGYAGPVAIGFKGVSSNQWSMVIQEQFTGTVLYSLDISASNDVYVLYQFPRAPLSLRVTNNGSVLGTINVEIVGQ